MGFDCIALGLMVVWGGFVLVVSGIWGGLAFVEFLVLVWVVGLIFWWCLVDLPFWWCLPGRCGLLVSPGV